MKRMILFMIAGLLWTITGCKDDKEVAISGMSLEPAILMLAKGETKSLALTVEPAGALHENIIWSSEKPDVATVNDQGKVTGISTGTSTISASTHDGGLITTCLVAVNAMSMTMGSPFARICMFGEGDCTIHWGDGTIETVPLFDFSNGIYYDYFWTDENSIYVFHHSYSGTSGCTIIITGENVTHLYINGYNQYNKLTSLDVRNNTALTTLNCMDNQLTVLDVSQNTSLTTLSCGYNLLQHLDISNNTALTHLGCNSNQLTDLDISNNPSLLDLGCNDNQLTNLDLYPHLTLNLLSCSNNQLTSIDVSRNTELNFLWCYNNQLTDLDVSHNTALVELLCDNNQLTDLDLSNNAALSKLWCDNNALSSLDLSNNTMLNQLWCNNNRLTSIDVSNNTLIRQFSCANNQLTALDVSNNIELDQAWCNDNELDTEALIALIKSLPHNNKINNIITIKSNPGVNGLSESDLSIATSKGWTIDR